MKNLTAAAKSAEAQLTSTIGIAHTRWATHGEPSDTNSHPHANSSGTLSCVHNGIIENYETIKKRLQEKGYVFKSDTDTEVLVHLVEDLALGAQVGAHAGTLAAAGRDMISDL